MTQRRLRIGIDAHAVGSRTTGNERFVTNLLRALPGVCSHQIVALVPDQLTADAVAAAAPGVTVERFAPSAPVARHLWSLGAASRGLDALIVQYAGPVRPPCPVVHVVHDASFITNPEWFLPSERLWMRRLIPWSVKRGSKIVTVSEFSRDELASSLHVDPGSIVVAHDGVDPVFTPDGPSGEPGFLVVGTDTPRKNLPMVGEAMRRLDSRTPRIRVPLLYAGPDDPPAEARSLGYLNDAALATAMRGAVALVHPARYEGFGLPPLEAMACGTPAIVADIPVMHEVCGDAALFVDPDDANAWAEALTRIATDPALRSSLAKAGIVQAARFTWADCATAVISAVEEAVAQTVPSVST